MFPFEKLRLWIYINHQERCHESCVDLQPAARHTLTAFILLFYIYFTWTSMATSSFGLTVCDASEPPILRWFQHPAKIWYTIPSYHIISHVCLVTIVLFLNLGMKSVQGGRSWRSQTSQRLSRNGHHWPTASAQVWSSQGANTSASGPHRSRNGGDNIKEMQEFRDTKKNIYKPDWQWFEVEKCLCIFFWVHGRIFQSTWPQKHLSQMAKCWVQNVGFKCW